MIPDDQCSMLGHGPLFGLPAFIVPALFWYSASYDEQFPDRLAAIERSARLHQSTVNIFETLVDMADLDFPGHDARKRACLNPAGTGPVQEWFRPTLLVDFDQKVLRGNCRLVSRDQDR